MPTILRGKMTQLEPITNILPIPITRVIHLRDSLFLIGYAEGGKIELRDLSKIKKDGEEPDAAIHTFTASGTDVEDTGIFDYMRDFDCKNNDESQIVMLFDSYRVGFLNLNEN